MIFGCISSVQYALQINGMVVGEIEHSRGLRQGDLLSPYLFIMCNEVFSRLLNSKQEVQGLKLGRTTPAINHLFYADDLLLVGKANLKSGKAMWDCLDIFCRWSGHQDKSNILFSPNTAITTQRLFKKL